MMLTKATDEGRIKGVYIPEIEDQITHGQSVDDTNAVIIAKREYVDNLFLIFRTLGEASGLFVKEHGVKVVLISEEELPEELQDLDWSFETDTSLSKLLGIFIGRDILSQMMVDYMGEMLDGKLIKARRNPYTLTMRVLVVNQLVSCIVSYML